MMSIFKRSLHELYKTEKPGVQIYETKKGFVTYKIEKDTLAILELYVHPRYRGTNIGYELMKTVSDKAKKLNTKSIITTLDPSDTETTGPLRSIFKKLGLKKHDDNVTVELELYSQGVS